MKKNLIATLLALAFGLFATTLAIAGDTAKSEGAKAPVYSASCPPAAQCGFDVKSNDKAEVVAMLKEHAKTHHNGMVLSDADAEAMVKVSEAKN